MEAEMPSYIPEQDPVKPEKIIEKNITPTSNRHREGTKVNENYPSIERDDEGKIEEIRLGFKDRYRVEYKEEASPIERSDSASGVESTTDTRPKEEIPEKGKVDWKNLGGGLTLLNRQFEKIISFFFRREKNYLKYSTIL